MLKTFFQFVHDLAGDAATNQVTSRLLFGTDWYMEAINPRAEDFVETWRTRYRAEFGDEAAERFLGHNALAFLGFTPGTKNAQRLEARYARFGVPAPSWLELP